MGTLHWYVGGRVYLPVHVGGMHVHACTGKCECLQHVHVHVTIVAGDIASCSFHLFSSKLTPKIICYAEMFFDGQCYGN